MTILTCKSIIQDHLFDVQLRIQDVHSNVCVVECTIAGRVRALTCWW